MSIVKACQKDDIPIKVIKMNKDIFAGLIAKDFNNSVDDKLDPSSSFRYRRKTKRRPWNTSDT